jgi:hypothetical protein
MDAGVTELPGRRSLQLLVEVVCQALDGEQIRIDPKKYLASPGNVPPYSTYEAAPPETNAFSQIMPKCGEDGAGYRKDYGSDNAIRNVVKMRPEMGPHKLEEFNHARASRVL